MSDFTSIKAQLQTLIGRCNAKTERTDADLTSAVGALIEGYGQSSEVEDYALYMSSANEGGFGAYAGSHYAYYDFTCFDPTVIFEEEMTVLASTKYNGAYGNGAVISEKVDLTGYSKIVFDYECNIPAKANDNFIGVFITPEKQAILHDIAVYKEDLLIGNTAATASGTKEIDVSSLSGEYYIGFSMQYTVSATLKISNMYMIADTQQGGSGGGGGSAEIPTCTVRFVKGTDAEFSNVVVYTECVNGEKRIVNIDNNAIGVTQDEYVLENVVCGSLIYFNWWYYTDAGEMEIDGGVIPIVNSLNGEGETMLFQAQTEPNSVSVITVSGWSDIFGGGSGL